MEAETVYIKQENLEVKKTEVRYAQMKRNYAELHMEWGGIYKVRSTMEALRQTLGEDFLPISRSCLVRFDQIHHLDSEIVLQNGERLGYALRQKQAIVDAVCRRRGCNPADFVVQLPRQVRQKSRAAAPVSQPEKQGTDAAEPVRTFPDGQYLPIVVDRRPAMVKVDTILYITVRKATAQLHLSDGKIYEIRRSLSALERELGDDFVRIFRDTLVSVKAVHSFTDSVNLVNGESLPYSPGHREQLRQRLAARQKQFIDSLTDEQAPATPEEYRAHYSCFDNAPFAFTDIEMVFSENCHAVDWIFRYGNQALAKIEKLPLEKILGASFSSLFSNMDSKWLYSYEQAALFGKTLELLDYSPEIDTNLKIICFPTFRGHCGCIMFNLDELDSYVGELSPILREKAVL